MGQYTEFRGDSRSPADIIGEIIVLIELVIGGIVYDLLRPEGWWLVLLVTTLMGVVFFTIWRIDHHATGRPRSPEMNPELWDS